MGGSLKYEVDERWSGPEPALAAARHLVRSCATDAHCSVTWDTSRLDAVAAVRPLLEGAGGDAVFRTEDPGPLVALLGEAGLDPGRVGVGDPADVRVIGYARILDALDHAMLATETTLSIEIGYREDVEEDGPGLDQGTVDRLVAAAGDDAIQLYWSCRWFGATSDVFNSVTLDLNGDVSSIGGHRPGSHRITVAVNYKLIDAEQIPVRIASVSGRRLVFRELS